MLLLCKPCATCWLSAPSAGSEWEGAEQCPQQAGRAVSPVSHILAPEIHPLWQILGIWHSPVLWWCGSMGLQRAPGGGSAHEPAPALTLPRALSLPGYLVGAFPAGSTLEWFRAVLYGELHSLLYSISICAYCLCDWKRLFTKYFVSSAARTVKRKGWKRMFFYTCQQWLHVCVIIQQPLLLRGLPAVLWSCRKHREAHESLYSLGKKVLCLKSGTCFPPIYCVNLYSDYHGNVSCIIVLLGFFLYVVYCLL